ncbi:MAG: substrate-binding domain-containing protein [Victivallaceae bacterium]
MKDLQYKKDILYRDLKQSILKGKYAPGEKLPKEELFSRELGVSRETLRVALDKLESESLILRLKSKGTFVRKSDSRKKRFLVLAELSGGNELPCHYILPGIERAANSMNIEIEICGLGFFDMQCYEDVSALLKNRNINGIILIACSFTGNERIVKLLTGQNIPILLPWAFRKDYQTTGWATFSCHERTAWRDALKHLKEMGHYRVMTLALDRPLTRGYSHAEYVELLREIGLDASEELIAYCPFDRDAIRKTIRKALDFPRTPTAIMCFSDFWAPDVYYAVKAAGMRIPEDIAVMGFISGINCEYMHPALSTVYVDFFEVGYKAAEMLAKADEWFKPHDRCFSNPFVNFDYRLEARASTAVRRTEEKMKKLDFALQNV